MNWRQWLYDRVHQLPCGGCWEWTGNIPTVGYGLVEMRTYGTRYLEGRTRVTDYAHRLTYQMERGQIPANMELDHLCRNRKCCNPAHLEVVTHQVNTQRAMNAQRNGRFGRYAVRVT